MTSPGSSPHVKLRSAEFVAGATAMEQLPPPAFAEVAFAGRSNVGKSSLLNRLTGRRKLARASRTPGATRAVNVFRIELAEPEATLDFVDLPGYGYAKRSKGERKRWGALMESFLRDRVGLRAVVVLIDVRRGFEDDDLDFLAWLEEIGRAAIVVATKLDLVKVSDRKLRIAELAKASGRRVLAVSAETGDGIDALWSTTLRAAHIRANGEDPR